MAEIIQQIFVNPPIAVARLGGSTSPQNAFTWVSSPNPRSNGETTIQPDWSLRVQPDGTVQPFLPPSLQFRDGPLIRPVCPFFEIWALVGQTGSSPETWREVPVTPALLTAHGTSLDRLTIRLDAKNLKVARRTANAELQYGTFPPVEIGADNNAVTPLLASSPPGVPATRRMIPSGRSIPLGSIQVLKSRAQPAPTTTDAWTQLVDGVPIVNVEVIRFRFTPAAGHFYGPLQAADLHTAPLPGGRFRPVDSTRAFLNSNTDWVRFSGAAVDQPADTYDGADVSQDRSLGVIDDTCEARIQVSLKLSGNRVLSTEANVFVGPPDFAPDRRPFLSLADELNDRSADSAARTNAMKDSEKDAWIEDLFERIYETVSLFNLDHWRLNGFMAAVPLTGNRLAPNVIQGDGTLPATRAMGGRDALRNRSVGVPGPNDTLLLPLTKHARTRHRDLSDLDFLRDFIEQNKGRIRALVRGPFELEGIEANFQTTMRMPPFMRNSNAFALTLSAWQYALLMEWVQAVEAIPAVAAAAPGAPPKPISPAAERRRAAVLARLAERGR